MFYAHCLQVNILEVILVSAGNCALKPLQGISWKIARSLVNIPLAVFAKQSHYIFRDREIFFTAGKLNMINWTINTLIQLHKSAQRNNAALNVTLD